MGLLMTATLVVGRVPLLIQCRVHPGPPHAPPLDWCVRCSSGSNIGVLRPGGSLVTAHLVLGHVGHVDVTLKVATRTTSGLVMIYEQQQRQGWQQCHAEADQIAGDSQSGFGSVSGR